MNLIETNQLLTRIQVVDNRQIGDSTVLLWHELLDDVDYAMAVEAVRLHFRETTAWLMPAHVRANVTRIESAQAAPVDEHGNALPVDVEALKARSRGSESRRTKEVTA